MTPDDYTRKLEEALFGCPRGPINRGSREAWSRCWCQHDMRWPSRTGGRLRRSLEKLRRADVRPRRRPSRVTAGGQPLEGGSRGPRSAGTTDHTPSVQPVSRTMLASRRCRANLIRAGADWCYTFAVGSLVPSQAPARARRRGSPPPTRTMSAAHHYYSSEGFSSVFSTNPR